MDAMSWIKRLLTEEQGQDLAEYAIALAVISVGVALISVALGGDVNVIWSNAQPALRTVIDAEP